MPTETLLVPERTIYFPGNSEPFDPREFFQTRRGLHVSDEFRKLVLENVEPVDPLPASMKVTVLSLTRSATDAQIQRGLPRGYKFEKMSEFCSRLSRMLLQQRDGTSGGLRTDELDVISYTSAYDITIIVLTSWDNNCGEWSVDATLPIEDNPWPEFIEVFSAAVE